MFLLFYYSFMTIYKEKRDETVLNRLISRIMVGEAKKIDG